MNKETKLGFWSRDFFIITLISLFTVMTNQVFYNTTPLYVDSMGGSASYSGALMTIFTLAALISRLICGKLIDRKGCRTIITGGAVIFCVFAAFYNFFPYLAALGFWRFFHGAGFAAAGTAAGAAVASTLRPQHMGKGINIFGLGQSLATCIGPYIGLSLIRGDDFRLVFWAASAMMAIVIILAQICKYSSCYEAEPLVADNRTKKSLKDWVYEYCEIRAIRPVIIQLLNSMSVAATISFLAFFSNGKTYANASLFFVVASFTMIGIRIVLAFFIDRISSLWILVPGSILGILSLLMIAYTQNSLVYLLAGAAYGISHGVIPPALQTLSFNSAPANRRGAVSATYYISVDAGVGVGALLWGIFIDLYGFLFMFWCASACLVIAIVLSFFFFRKGI